MKKKLLSLFTLLLCLVGNVVAETKFAVVKGYTIPTDLKVTTVSGITMTLGGAAANYSVSTNSDLSGYTAYLKASVNVELTDNIPTSGNYYKFEPTVDGNLTVGVRVNKSSNKNCFYICEGEDSPTQLYESNNSSSIGASVSFAVVAGKTYYLYQNQNKLGLYGFEFTPSSTSETVDITVNANDIVSYSIDNALDFTNVTDIYAYTATAASEDGVTLTRVKSSVPASTGLILYNPNSDSKTVSVPVPTETPSEVSNLLKPAVADQFTIAASTDGAYHYIFGTKSGEYGFFKVTEAYNSAANKAYLETTSDISKSTAEAKAISIVFNDNEVTGIEAVEVAKQSGDEAYYTLSGVKVAQPSKGIYIKGGKKVVIR